VIERSDRSEVENRPCIIAPTDIFRMHHCRRLQQRAWLLALAGLDRVPADRPVPVTDDGLQKTLKRSLENCGLGADGQEVPALEGIDRLVGHHAHVGGLEIERLGPAPIESHDRIE
jgi:hypothetical protein